jgi:hypothetical protein
MKKIPQADLSIREVVGEAVTYTLRAREEVPGAIFDVGSAGRRMELISKSPRSRAPAHYASGPVGVEPTGIVQQPNTDPTDRSDAFSAAERLDDEDYPGLQHGPGRGNPRRHGRLLARPRRRRTPDTAALTGLAPPLLPLPTPYRRPGPRTRRLRHTLEAACRIILLEDQLTEALELNAELSRQVAPAPHPD